MVSEIFQHPARAGFFLSIIFLSACTDSSSPTESSYTVSYLDRGLPYPVELSVNGASERLIQGQELRGVAEDGVKLKLVIESHSPLVQCGFRPRGERILEFAPGSDEDVILDCESVDFLQYDSPWAVQDVSEGSTLVSDGEPESTRTIWPEGSAVPLGRMGQDILVRTRSDSGIGFMWSDSETLSLKATVWPDNGLKSVVVNAGRFFLLYGDDSGQGELRTSESPESDSTPFATLPALDEGLTYDDLGTRDGQLVVYANGSVDGFPTRQFLVAHPDRPQHIQGPLTTQGELTSVDGDIGKGVFLEELDRDRQEAWLHGFIANENLIGKWQIPEDRVQRVRLWRQRSLEPVVGVQYLDESGSGCASIYRFANLQWELLRDFCRDHSQIEVLHWEFWGKTFHMAASAASGPIIPSEPALIVVPDVDEPQDSVLVVNSDQFEGRIIDSLPTLGGGYFYATSPLPEGCGLGPWFCVDQGRLYHFSTESSVSVSKVFEGQFANGVFMPAEPLISEPWPVAERVLFNVVSPELGSELWRSDGTPEGTYPLKDLSPGLALTGKSVWSNTMISTRPLNVYP